MTGGSPWDGDATDAIAENIRQIAAIHGVPPASASHGQYPLDPDAARHRLIASMRTQRAEVFGHLKALSLVPGLEHRHFTADERDKWDDLCSMLDHIDRRIAALAGFGAKREQIALTSMDGNTVYIDAQPSPASPVAGNSLTYGPPVSGGAGGTGSVTVEPVQPSAMERLVEEAETPPPAAAVRRAKTRKPCIDCHSRDRGERAWVYLEGGRNRRCGYCAELISLKARSPVQIIPLEPKRIVRPHRRVHRAGMAALTVWAAGTVLLILAPHLAWLGGLLCASATVVVPVFGRRRRIK